MMIFFDIDDTLLDSESAHKVALKKIVDEYSLDTDPEELFSRWMSITDHYLNLFFRNEISQTVQRTERITKLFSLAGKEIPEVETIPVYLKYHRHFLESCKVFPETIPVLEQLKGFRMGIISNGPVADQTYKLEKNGLIRYFDTVVISEAVGYSKPEKEIFDAALQKAGQIPSGSIFIGDSYENDYLGGKNAGMKAIWLDRKKSPNPAGCESVHSLVELIDLLPDILDCING